jgi:acid stress-induced BolA-like protein IbaG/YrbA
MTGGGGHLVIEVTSPAFAGRSMLERQRMVYGAIVHLIKGAAAPVHAVESLKTRTPSISCPGSGRQRLLTTRKAKGGLESKLLPSLE